MKVLTCLICALFYVQLTIAADDVGKPKFFTCDFTLPDPEVKLEEFIKYLPEECQNLSDADKALLTRESENFANFNEKLQNYENSLGQDTPDYIHKDWDFRDELYTNADLHLCGNGTDTLEEYIGCMIEKRDEMVAKIDERIAELQSSQ